MKNKKTIIFSGYWDVKDNPKGSKRLGHLKFLKNKNIDVLICESKQQQNQSNFKYITLEKEELPSLPFLKNLKKYCDSREFVNLKFGLKIKSKIFFELCCIWTSKILFFENVYKNNKCDDIIWVDCVHAKNYELIKKQESERVNINKYSSEENFPEKPFNGLLSYDLNGQKEKISANIIKMPTTILNEFTEAYKDSLIHADKNFEIYDEETVLTHMYSKHKEMFNIIN